jgi:uncharacterized NAD(P)/FAD-binding protein YdhS
MLEKPNEQTPSKPLTKWLFQDRHKECAKKLRHDVEKAFTEHPESAGETYLEHLWFTVKMSGRFAFVSSAIMLHGLFPFLCTRTASTHTEQLYRIMKTRIPKKRRDEIDREFDQPIRIYSNSGDVRVAIIGGGFSGALVLAHMIKAAEGALIIEWFEPNALGEGVAYNTKNAIHLLNVRAERMGAFGGKPEHFYEWLQSDSGKKVITNLWPNHEITGETYVPRVVYAAYIKHIVHEALAEARTKHIVVNIHATSVSDAALHNPDTQQLALIFHEAGKTHELVVDAAVLATGNLPPRSHGFQTGLLAGKDNYVDDVWNTASNHLFPHRVNELPADSEIVIVGTGLTMVDAVLTLKAGGYKGRISAISRSGVVPNVQVHSKSYPIWEWVHSPHYAPRTVAGLLTRLKQEVQKAEAEGYSWQSVVDSLRPVTQTLWKQLDVREKRKFLTRLSSFWNIHRHRMAQEIHQEIRSLEQNGTLTIIAGKIYYIGSDKDGITVAYRKRGTNRVETIRPTLVLNCTGPEYDIAASDHILLKRLRDRELITVGLLRAGIEVTAQGTAKGKAEDSLFPIGTLMVGELLECTAVPELREQTQIVARQVLARVKTLHASPITTT